MFQTTNQTWLIFPLPFLLPRKPWVPPAKVFACWRPQTHNEGWWGPGNYRIGWFHEVFIHVMRVSVIIIYHRFQLEFEINHKMGYPHDFGNSPEIQTGDRLRVHPLQGLGQWNGAQLFLLLELPATVLIPTQIHLTLGTHDHDDIWRWTCIWEWVYTCPTWQFYGTIL